MPNTRVLMWGLGEIGTRCAKMLFKRPQITLAGAISHQVGLDLGSVIDSARLGVNIVAVPEDLGAVEADICLLATYQRVPELAPQIEWLLERGISVIVSGEEMIFPWASHPELADHLDAAARAAGCSVYGTGINPGFVMDALALCLSSCCAEVERMEITRVSDFSPYGPGPLRSLGVGLSPAEFRRGLQAETVDGHIGFKESIGVIARALDWKIEDYREQISPIVTEVPRRTPHISVSPGFVAGCDHSAEALIADEVVIRLNHPQQVDPAAADVKLGDFVNIEGTPGIRMSITPEIEGGGGTAARMVNAIGSVMRAPAGLLTMDELTLPFVTPLGTPGTRAGSTRRDG